MDHILSRFNDSLKVVLREDEVATSDCGCLYHDFGLDSELLHPLSCAQFHLVYNCKERLMVN